ncbi:MAG: PIN domain-containing protein [Candidatus Marinimicrobia bacterium]|jgi:predicted nucleic acid-binding protein|nr:PIN domain-containing protein [Candidatus Neomarinimicrobiota bacterium]
MPKRVLIIDTSVLSCWLRIPGKDRCGPREDLWDFDRIERLLIEEIEAKSTLVLPVATLIETGNHIAHSNGDRFILAQQLAEVLRKTAEEEEPWAAFEHQSALWRVDNLRQLSEQWPKLAAQGLGIGDATIVDVAKYYAGAGMFDVVILTGDRGLKSFEPTPTLVPRRRAK